ncbi:DNA-directed RNA polymerase [Handroanthus impetiginosus]|uniref:DNA-directed RNA polymerase n=1 Tax=Handroanthus impetiginosus TaxID=429701 RepID=A0A2G9FWN2_9LAMI|nr:DNA-directed RNA polymerase [Handroanthus impetiginosus]
MDSEDEYYNQGYNDQGYEEEENEDEEITQEDAWAVISAYFEEKGLVRQQLDSFDEFIQNTMQEIVDESAEIEIRPESQHNPGHQSDFAEKEKQWQKPSHCSDLHLIYQKRCITTSFGERLYF